MHWFLGSILYFTQGNLATSISLLKTKELSDLKMNLLCFWFPALIFFTENIADIVYCFI